LDAVVELVFFLCLSLPSLNGGQIFNRLAFVSATEGLSGLLRPFAIVPKVFAVTRKL